jgi:hypothetical protein
MSILNILETLIPVGFTFSLDSPINIGGVQKKPDLLVKCDASDPGFIIEVTTLSHHLKDNGKRRWHFESYGIILCSPHSRDVLAISNEF